MLIHLTSIHCDALVNLLSQEEDFEDMISLADDMESQCGHLFEKVIVNGDIAVAFRELKAALERVEQAEVQWLPAEWMCSSPTKARRSCGHLDSWIWTFKGNVKKKKREKNNSWLSVGYEVRIFVIVWIFLRFINNSCDCSSFPSCPSECLSLGKQNPSLPLSPSVCPRASFSAGIWLK